MVRLPISTRICVIGLGYVGLPLAARFAEAGFNVVGVDTNLRLRQNLQKGIDETGVLTKKALRVVKRNLTISSHPPSRQDVYIICVPTPEHNGKPDYSYIESVVASLSRISKEATVVLESTVAPGATATYIQGKLPTDRVGYSPERVDPKPGCYSSMFNDTKVLASDHPSAGNLLKKLYSTIFKDAVLYTDPRVLELAKCFENTQRDINIAAMNELSQVCYREGIAIEDVMSALSYKSNALGFHPGMVGGHCIAVDPYYLVDFYGEAEHRLPTLARRINENHINFIADIVASTMAKRVLMLGATYKPNVPDTRNSGALALSNILSVRYNIEVDIFDPLLGQTDIMGTGYRTIIGAVNHSLFDDLDICTMFGLIPYSTFVDLGDFKLHRNKFVRNVRL